MRFYHKFTVLNGESLNITEQTSDVTDISAAILKISNSSGSLDFVPVKSQVTVSIKIVYSFKDIVTSLHIKNGEPILRWALKTYLNINWVKGHHLPKNTCNQYIPLIENKSSITIKLIISFILQMDQKMSVKISESTVFQVPESNLFSSRLLKDSIVEEITREISTNE